MTAVVFDGKTLAADSATFTRDYVICGYHDKIEKWSRGYVGTAGYVKDGILFVQWLEGELEEPPKLHKAFEALFTEDGKVYYCGRSLTPELADPPIGIGSAGTDVEVLCRVGYSGKEAIQKAMEWHKGIGGNVQEVIL